MTVMLIIELIWSVFTLDLHISLSNIQLPSQPEHSRAPHNLLLPLQCADWHLPVQPPAAQRRGVSLPVAVGVRRFAAACLGAAGAGGASATAYRGYGTLRCRLGNFKLQE